MCHATHENISCVLGDTLAIINGVTIPRTVTREACVFARDLDSTPSASLRMIALDEFRRILSGSKLAMEHLKLVAKDNFWE